MSDSPKSFWKPRLIFGIILSLIFIPIGFLVLLLTAYVGGEEFSPDDFSRRRFSYVRLPIVKWVLRGIEYEDLTSDFELSLGTERWISTSPPKTWHLVGEGYGVQPAECDARFLVDFLTLKSQEPRFVYYWQQWNERYPELAKTYWPLVAQLARDEMYLAIPELMQLAMGIGLDSAVPSAEDFQIQLKSSLSTAYQRFAELDRSNGRDERADLRFQRAADCRSE